MKTPLVIIAVLLLLASLACIGWTTVEVIRGKCELWSGEFFGAAGFHGVTAIIAVVLLGIARGPGEICCKQPDQAPVEQTPEGAAS